jgi:hypothetical protein
MITSYIVSNDKDIVAALSRLEKTVSDFRIPFGMMANEFYKTNKKIFQLKSKGLYRDFGGFDPLREVGFFNGKPETARSKAKRLKKAQVGFVYPLLFRTGRLASSLLNRSDPEAVYKLDKKNLILGTGVPYALYHQTGTPKLPQRKVVFIDGGPYEQSRGANISGRRETWLNIINQYIVDTINEEGFAK